MAFRGIDSRDLYRAGSGLTLRRLHVLIRALPHDAPLWADLRATEEEAQRATPDDIRAAQERFKARQEAALRKAEEAS